MDTRAVSSQPTQQIWFTPAELARRWRISKSAVDHLKCNTDLLTRHRFGRGVRFKIDDIERAERLILGRGGRLPGRRRKPVDAAAKGD